MTQIKKLVELINEADSNYNFELSVGKILKPRVEYEAEFLLKNGVIVPPCKVGDTVWEIEEPFFEDEDKCAVVKSKVEQFYIGTSLDLIEMEDFDTYIFHTKEEAEKALAEKRADND